jgi:hypothetical protein
MAEGNSQSQWATTSLICAIIANAHRDPKKSRPFKPADFNPHLDPKKERRREAIVITKGNMGVLKDAFTSFKKHYFAKEKL